MGFGSGVSGGVGFGSALPTINALPGIIQRIAGQNLSGHVAVWIDDSNTFWIADPTNDACVDMICGITTGATGHGGTAYARFTGELTDPSFNFQPGPVWLGAGGSLVQTQPTSGNLILLGTSAGPNTLQVRIEFICKLS